MTAKVNGMRRLPKTHEKTWWNGKSSPGPSSLDHIYASEHLKFRHFSGGAEVRVDGWVNESSDPDKIKWIDQFSDHSLLFGEIRD